MVWLYVVIGLAIVFVALKVLGGMEAGARRKFMDSVKSLIAQKYPELELRHELAFGWAVKCEDFEGVMSLDSMYTIYRADPNRLDELVDQRVDGMRELQREMDPDWDNASGRLLPSLKPQDYLDTVCSKMNGGEDYVSKLVVSDLENSVRVLIALDSKNALSFVTADDLQKWGITEEEAIRTAVGNLSVKTTEDMWAAAEKTAVESGVFMMSTGDCYDASRILLPEFYQHASKAVGAERIAVAIPDRDTVIAVPEGIPHLLDALREIAASQYKQAPYPISVDIFTLPKES